MAKRQFDDETLMAWADGELDAETAKAVEDAAAGDPEVARRLARFTATRDALQGAAAERLKDPVPPDLEARALAAIAGAGASDGPANVVDFARLGRSAAARAPWRPVALAAGIALAAGLGIGLLAAPPAPGDAAGELSVAMLGSPGLSEALASVPSGERREVSGGGVFSAIASFRNDDGEFCREFEFDREGSTIVSVACRADDRWDVRLAIAASAPAEDGYAPASSLETLDAYLMAIGAGAPLSEADEASALGAIAG